MGLDVDDPPSPHPPSPPPTQGRRLRREQWLALAAALVTVTLWASAFVGIRSAGRSLSPGPLSLARLGVGSMVLGAFALAKRERLPHGRDLLGIALIGVVWFGGYNLALNEAERRVDAGTAAMLVNLGPIFIALLAGWFLREGFPGRLFVGCAVAFAGTVVIGLASARLGASAGLGAVLCVVAALAYAVGVTLQKPLLARAPAIHVTWLACTVGAMVCLPFAPSLLREVGAAETSALAWTVYLGVFPTAVGFTTWAYALSRTTAGKMGSTTYLVPPLAVLMGWAFLGESPPTIALLGGALCLAGVVLSRRGPKASGRT